MAVIQLHISLLKLCVNYDENKLIFTLLKHQMIPMNPKIFHQATTTIEGGNYVFIQ